MANQTFGNYHAKHFKLVLIGGDRTLPFEKFATNEAIQMTEIFEYSQKLSNSEFVQPSFLYYKFLYAIRLLDFGFASQSLHYLEELAKAVTKHPYELDPDLAQVIHQVYRYVVIQGESFRIVIFEMVPVILLLSTVTTIYDFYMSKRQELVILIPIFTLPKKEKLKIFIFQNQSEN